MEYLTINFRNLTIKTSRLIESRYFYVSYGRHVLVLYIRNTIFETTLQTIKKNIWNGLSLMVPISYFGITQDLFRYFH